MRITGTLLLLLAVAVCHEDAKASSTLGKWDSFANLPFYPPHVSLLPTRNVMIWPGASTSGDNPMARFQTGAMSPRSKAGYDLFCGGHSFTADGKLFVAGGHISNDEGLPYASLYDPFTNSWEALPNMNAGRWYPTVTTLGNGDILVTSGTINSDLGANTLPQVFRMGTGTWRDLTGAQLPLPSYPRMFLAPNGKVFDAGPGTTSRYLDTTGAGAWSVVAEHIYRHREYGSAVMYAPGKILVMGGGDPPLNTAEVINLNQAAPRWREVSPMQFARRHLNATLLPDGTVLVTGGTDSSDEENVDNPILAAELWDPALETWTTLASASVPRLYHSAAILMPGGRVMTTGGNYRTELELFRPPYFFKGNRPTVISVPGTVRYNKVFTVGTPNGGIVKITMLRLSSTTHSFNMGQYFSSLTFAKVAGGYAVQAPLNGNVAPPGYYLFFILNRAGVPSVATIVRLIYT